MSDISTRILSVAAIACSLAALALYAFSSPSSSVEGEYSDRIEELERELSYLRGNVYQGPGGLNAFEDSVPASQFVLSSESSGRNGGGASVEQDVDDMRWMMTVRGFMPATEEHIARSEETIFDKGQDINQKLVALRVLRRSDQLKDNVVREMISVFHGTDSYKMQEEILENLDDVTTPELAPTLLKASADSPSYRVRREAIDSMSGFLPDPDLEEWLRYVKKNDGHKRVRAEAGRLLKKYAKD